MGAASVWAQTGTHTMLTPDDLKTYLALILIWEQNDRPLNDLVPFSLYQLARVMGITWRAQTATKLRQSLNRLLIVTMKWENAFYYKPSGETFSQYNPMHSLSYLVLGEQRKKGKKIADQKKGLFKFDQHVLENLMANYSKPVYIDDALALNNEIAILLLMHLDVVMADKSFYARNSIDLFHDLGLQKHKKYQYPSGRKQALQPALKELRGKRLSTGVLSKIELIANSRGDDFKLSVHKGKTQIINVEATTITENTSTTVQAITDEQQALIEQLHKNFALTRAKATKLVMQHYEATKHQIAAWPYRDHSQIQDKAGWIIRAIEQAYELPHAYLDAVKEQEQRERIKRARTTIEACGLCDENGFRMIERDGQHGVKRCTHNPTIEEKISFV
jgi:hypothetical protein